MAKRAKKEKEAGEDGAGVSAFRGNGFDPAIAQGFVQRVENLHSNLATEKSEFMTRCKVIHSDIKEVMTEAKNAGIPKKALKNVVKHRALLNKAEDVRNDLEGEDQDSFDQLLHALGSFAETGLGEAALKAA